MKVLLAVLMLLLNFTKAAFISGLDTAKIILHKPADINSGLAYMHYGELNENAAALLGAMITLTPGTSLIEIDTRSRQLVLHLLDLDCEDETLALIQRDYCDHLNVLNEVFS